MDTNDTIAAVCTGSGGAIAIIRISGKDALVVGNRVWRGGKEMGCGTARMMLLGTAAFADHGGDRALAVYMPGPASYTGEDIVELHCHGGNLVAGKILESVLQAGSRMAEPGEFTYRAFVNGKIDLTQAEAVADIINAGSNMALQLAERQSNGLLGRKIGTIRALLVDILAETESRMDFSEENLDWSEVADVSYRLAAMREELQSLYDSRREGIILRQGIRVVIAGRPNAGKSSLLNLLLGYDRAIVTAIPGTTRDTLEEQTHLRGVPVRLIDTAGIREADNIIEGMGIDRSRKSLAQAQIVFWLLDAAAPTLDDELEGMRRHLHSDAPAIVVWNKQDLAAGRDLPPVGFPSVGISATQGQGIDGLLDAFEKAVWQYPHEAEPELAVSARHAALLENACEALPDAMVTLSSEDWELAAVHLRDAITALGKITGETITPDILDNIFSRFCIGK